MEKRMPMTWQESHYALRLHYWRRVEEVFVVAVVLLFVFVVRWSSAQRSEAQVVAPAWVEKLWLDFLPRVAILRRRAIA